MLDLRQLRGTVRTAAFAEIVDRYGNRLVNIDLLGQRTQCRDVTRMAARFLRRFLRHVAFHERRRGFGLLFQLRRHIGQFLLECLIRS
jgi:hypothetical protein